MWNFIKLWSMPAVFLFGSIEGLRTAPPGERWYYVIGFLISIPLTIAAWRTMRGTDGNEPLTYALCERCGFYPPKHALSECHFCRKPVVYPPPSCLCQRCMDRQADLYATLGNH